MNVPDERASSAQPAGGAPNAEAANQADAGDELQAALARAEARSQEHRDLYMRALAELDNVRKRASRDVEQAHRFALDKFAAELIGVKDSLEMGLAAGPSADTATLLAGTDATLKLLSKAFEKSGLTEINPPSGESFNPEWHEAMVSQESAQYPANTVLQTVQKGYQLNGRLLRPARVIVSREPSA